MYNVALCLLFAGRRQNKVKSMGGLSMVGVILGID